MTMLDEAQALAARGFRVVPICTPMSYGCSCRRPNCGGSNGKHPRILGWEKLCTTDAGQIRAWWGKWPDANIGLAMGGPSRLVAVDIDGPEGRTTIAELEQSHGAIPATLTSHSGRKDGGEHRFFRVPVSLDIRLLKNRASHVGPKVDIRTEGGQVVAPPSLHVSGNRYTWADRKTPIAELPPWLFTLAARTPVIPVAPAPKAAEPEIAERARRYLASIPRAVSGQGGHRQTLLAAEHLVRGFDLDDGTAYSLLCEWNNGCDPPWSERELQHKIREARMAGTAIVMRSHLKSDWTPTRSVSHYTAKREPLAVEMSRAMLGVLLDVPAIAECEDVADLMNTLEGDASLAVAARLNMPNADTEALLGRVPMSLRDFVSSRLAHPVCATQVDARRLFCAYARTIRNAQPVKAETEEDIAS